MAVFSEATRGMTAECDTSSSVPKAPGARPTSPSASSSVPVVMTNGLPEPARVVPDRLNGPQVDGGPDRHVGEVVDVAQVDDAVGLGGATAQAVEVLEVAPQHLGAGVGQGGGGGVGTGEAHDLVPGSAQFRDDGGADEAGPAGDEETHGTNLQVVGAPGPAVRAREQ